jgi:hypothetical protein
MHSVVINFFVSVAYGVYKSIYSQLEFLGGLKFEEGILFTEVTESSSFW